MARKSCRLMTGSPSTLTLALGPAVPGAEADFVRPVTLVNRANASLTSSARVSSVLVDSCSAQMATKCAYVTYPIDVGSSVSTSVVSCWLVFGCSDWAL